MCNFLKLDNHIKGAILPKNIHRKIDILCLSNNLEKIQVQIKTILNRKRIQHSKMKTIPIHFKAQTINNVH